MQSPATRRTTTPNAKLVAAVTPTLQGLNDEMGALEFAFSLEDQAAYTYAAALTLLQDPAYAAATSTILPIEAQHQVVLGLALGKSVTDVFPTERSSRRARRRHRSAQAASTRPSSPEPDELRRTTNDEAQRHQHHEIRRQLRSIDRMNDGVMPRWRGALSASSAATRP